MGTRVKRRGSVPLLPVAYLRLLIDIMTERGMEPRQLLARAGLTPAQLLQSELRVRVDDAARVARQAIEATGDAGLGFELGLHMQPTIHGPLGYALLSCASIQSAMELMIRFAHLRQPFVSLRVVTEQDCVVLQTQDLQDLGRLRRMFYESLLVAIARTVGLLLGESAPDCELWFDGPEPSYYPAYRERLPRLRYGMPAIQLRLPLALLQRRPLMADAGALRAAIEACEREQLLTSTDSLSQRVLAQLQATPGVYPGLEVVAARLCVSSRTLKRHLNKAGTTYQGLLDGQRHRAAMSLLGRPELSLRQISELLGYGDPPSFTRAFRRWCGKTPAQARNEFRTGAIVGPGNAAAPGRAVARLARPPRISP